MAGKFRFAAAGLLTHDALTVRSDARLARLARLGQALAQQK
jgi:hypothetical protein